ncbi:glycosyltransferase family 4 protein [Mucilaginibacter sp. HD30]
MKVAILSNDFRVYWKGRLVYLQQFLSENGIQLQAIELFGKGSPYNFDLYNNNYSWWTCLFPDSDATQLSKKEITIKIFDTLNNFNPDVVITSPITFFAGALGMRWAKQKHKKHIMFDDAKPLVQFRRNRLVRWVRDTITAQTDALWLPSVDYESEYPTLNKKSTLLFYGFNCIDNSFFKPQIQNKFNSKVIICVARLVPIKNLEALLYAWKNVEETNAGWSLNIIGEGPLHSKLNRLAKQLNLLQIAFNGAVKYNELPGYLHSAEALILPSFSETWGLVVNEAMASGLPILLSNRVNAAKSLLKDGANGYLFNPYDESALSAVLLKFIALSSDQKLKMSALSLDIINDMDYQEMGINLLNALNKLVVKKRKKINFVPYLLLNLWSGKHDISAWNNL